MKKEDIIIGETYLLNPKSDSKYIPQHYKRTEEQNENFTTPVKVFSQYSGYDCDFVVILLDKSLVGHCSHFIEEELPKETQNRLWHVRASMLYPLDKINTKDKDYEEMFI